MMEAGDGWFEAHSGTLGRIRAMSEKCLHGVWRSTFVFEHHSDPGGAAMSNHQRIQLIRHRARLEPARKQRAFAISLGLSVLLLPLLASRADAACYMRLPMSMLEQPKIVINDSARTVYRTSLKETNIHSSACTWAFGWPVSRSIEVLGEWNKATKTAKETVKVALSTPAFPNSPAAGYVGVTSQKCKADPWSVYNAGCPSWFIWWLSGGQPGVSKQQKAAGWNTSLIPWTTFDYRGPYPATRPLMGCCWFEPWT
jgi:hypothetical protein